jgi:hypothetical protein
MNIRHLAVALLTVASSAQASQPETFLAIDCAAPHRPSQAEVSHVFGIDNFTSAYAARENVMRVAHIACMRGATSVNIVAEMNSASNTTNHLVAMSASTR